MLIVKSLIYKSDNKRLNTYKSINIIKKIYNILKIKQKIEFNNVDFDRGKMFIIRGDDVEM